MLVQVDIGGVWVTFGEPKGNRVNVMPKREKYLKIPFGVTPEDYNYARMDDSPTPSPAGSFTVEGKVEIMPIYEYDYEFGIAFLLTNSVQRDDAIPPYSTGTILVQLQEWRPFVDLTQFVLFIEHATPMIGPGESYFAFDNLPYPPGTTVEFRIFYNGATNTASNYVRLNPTDPWIPYGVGIPDGNGLPPGPLPILTEPWSVGFWPDINSAHPGLYHQYRPIYYMRLLDGVGNPQLEFNAENFMGHRRTARDSVAGNWNLIGDAYIGGRDLTTYTEVEPFYPYLLEVDAIQDTVGSETGSVSFTLYTKAKALIGLNVRRRVRILADDLGVKFEGTIRTINYGEHIRVGVEA